MKIVFNNMKKIVFAGTVLLLVLVTSGGVAIAGEQVFHDNDPIVYRVNFAFAKLSRDDGFTTGNLLSKSSLDIASVEIGEKIGDIISHQALPTGHYNGLINRIDSIDIKGVVEVSPDAWNGTWEDGKGGVRYYYTKKGADPFKDHKSTRDEAKAAAQEMKFDIGETSTEDCDINILANETTTVKVNASCTIFYFAEYDESGKFTNGYFVPGPG